MSKKQAPGSYSFSTTATDTFLRRVAKEAKPRHRFLLTHARNPYLHVANVDLLVRTDVLSRCKEAGLSFPEPLSKNVVPRTGFTRLSFGALDEKDAATLTHKLNGLVQHAKNFLNGRHVRVTVQAL